jgi:hypothetical protein
MLPGLGPASEPARRALAVSARTSESSTMTLVPRAMIAEFPLPDTVQRVIRSGANASTVTRPFRTLESSTKAGAGSGLRVVPGSVSTPIAWVTLFMSIWQRRIPEPVPKRLTPSGPPFPGGEVMRASSTSASVAIPVLTLEATMIAICETLAAFPATSRASVRTAGKEPGTGTLRIADLSRSPRSTAYRRCPRACT